MLFYCWHRQWGKVLICHASDWASELSVKSSGFVMDYESLCKIGYGQYSEVHYWCGNFRSMCSFIFQPCFQLESDSTWFWTVKLNSCVQYINHIALHFHGNRLHMVQSLNNWAMTIWLASVTFVYWTWNATVIMGWNNRMSALIWESVHVGWN